MLVKYIVRIRVIFVFMVIIVNGNEWYVFLWKRVVNGEKGGLKSIEFWGFVVVLGLDILMYGIRILSFRRWVCLC